MNTKTMTMNEMGIDFLLGVFVLSVNPQLGFNMMMEILLEATHVVQGGCPNCRPQRAALN